MPKRGNGEGTIRQRPDGVWEARLTLPSGMRKSIYGKTRGEVQVALRKAHRDLDHGLDLTAQRQTVGAFLDRWLVDVAKPSLRPGTWSSYEGCVRLHITPAIGRVQLTALSPQHVQAMLNEREGAGLSPRTVAYLRAILRRALADALRWGLVTRNVATLTKAPRVVQKRVEPLSVDQVRAFAEATCDEWYGPLFTVAVTTGLRQGELFGLRWRDVDLAGGILRVAHALQYAAGEHRLVEPKTERSRRTIRLPALAAEAFRTQRVRQMKREEFLGDGWRNELGLVFTSTVGTPCNPSNVTLRLHTILERAGLPRQRFHDLRHSAASLLLASGEHPRVVMEILGHSQIALTMNTYSHVMPAALDGAAKRLDDLLEPMQEAPPDVAPTRRRAPGRNPRRAVPRSDVLMNPDQ